MRRALSHEIWRPHYTVGADRRCRRFFRKRFVGIAIGPLNHAETIAKPAQRLPCSLSDAHHMPSVRNRMTKSMQSPATIHRGTIGGSEDNAGSSDGGVNCAR